MRQKKEVIGTNLGRPQVAYKTKGGMMIVGRFEDAIQLPALSRKSGHVNLIFTSPPFPLRRKKRYGNKTGEEYLEWIQGLAPKLSQLLTEDGSIVLEIGNSWEIGRPVMSTLPLEALLQFLRGANLQLCQQFICHNPARLPGPAQWVNIERVRLKDSFTTIWWMSRTDRPKADNSKVLVEYSAHMRRLLKVGKYNSGARPSEHVIGAKSFLRNNGGAIPPSVLEFSNTGWKKTYLSHCKQIGVKPHPARMPPGLAEFFIKFLTDPGDLVLDPFAGSNTTGAVAEQLGRNWISVEPVHDYILGSQAHFKKLTNPSGI